MPLPRGQGGATCLGHTGLGPGSVGLLARRSGSGHPGIAQGVSSSGPGFGWAPGRVTGSPPPLSPCIPARAIGQWLPAAARPRSRPGSCTASSPFIISNQAEQGIRSSRRRSLVMGCSLAPEGAGQLPSPFPAARRRLCLLHGTWARGTPLRAPCCLAQRVWGPRQVFPRVHSGQVLPTERTELMEGLERCLTRGNTR